jgi:hypothetical protein
MLSMPKQVQDKNGNFVPKTKTNIVRHQLRTKKYLIPIMLVVIAVGGYVVSRSFASTTTIYSYTTCAPRYDDTCLRDSVEANVATLYQAVLGRPADPSGLNYYAKKVTSRSLNYGQVASNLLASSRGKELYPSTDPVVYVQALYTNLFNRQPTGAEQNQWVGYIVGKKLNFGQVAARLALEYEYKTDQEPATLALLKDKYKIVQPTGEYKVVAQFDLAGKDAKYCKGKIETDAALGSKACVVVPADQTVGLYSKIVTIPGVTMEPGEYDLVYRANYKAISTSSQLSAIATIPMHYATVTKADGKTPVLSGNLPGDVEQYAWASGWNRLDRYENSARMEIDRPASQQNSSIILFSRNVASASISTVELRKRMPSGGKDFLMVTELQYAGFTTNSYPEYSYGSSNPAVGPGKGEPRKSCQFGASGAKPKKCTVTVLHSAKSGRHQLSGYIYDSLYKGRSPINFTVKVTRVDTNEVVSENKITTEDSELMGVFREYTLPLNLRPYGKFYGIRGDFDTFYQLKSDATVKIELLFDQPTTYISEAKNPTDSETNEIELWHLGTWPAR